MHTPDPDVHDALGDLSDEDWAIYDAAADSLLANPDRWKTLALGEVCDRYGVLGQAGKVYIFATQNGAGGLAAKDVRQRLPQIEFFSLGGRGQDYFNLHKNGAIQKARRHAEMNLVMLCACLHINEGAGRNLSNFNLEDYLLSLAPTRVICPECQLALCFLSRGFCRFQKGWTDVRDSDGNPVLINKRNGVATKNWTPPWRDYRYPNPIRATAPHGHYQVGCSGDLIMVAASIDQRRNTFKYRHDGSAACNR